jgi:hypothetical protein
MALTGNSHAGERGEGGPAAARARRVIAALWGGARPKAVAWRRRAAIAARSPWEFPVKANMRDFAGILDQTGRFPHIMK